MKTRNVYEFEGAMRTMREIGEMVPCLSASTVRAYVLGGVKTVVGMTSMNKQQARSVRERAAEVEALVGEWDSN